MKYNMNRFVEFKKVMGAETIRVILDITKKYNAELNANICFNRNRLEFIYGDYKRLEIKFIKDIEELFEYKEIDEDTYEFLRTTLYQYKAEVESRKGKPRKSWSAWQQVGEIEIWKD